MNLSETIKSNAKINLSLDVLNLREDGYHNIDSIFQEISLHDTISISINKTSEIKVSTNFVATAPTKALFATEVNKVTFNIKFLFKF